MRQLALVARNNGLNVVWWILLNIENRPHQNIKTKLSFSTGFGSVPAVQREQVVSSMSRRWEKTTTGRAVFQGRASCASPFISGYVWLDKSASRSKTKAGKAGTGRKRQLCFDVFIVGAWTMLLDLTLLPPVVFPGRSAWSSLLSFCGIKMVI